MALLSRAGREAVIRRKDTTGTDQLNNKTGNYASIGVEVCAYYDPSSGGGQTASGEISITTPHFAFSKDADIQLNDRVVYDQIAYEVEKVTERPTHTVAVTKEV